MSEDKINSKKTHLHKSNTRYEFGWGYITERKVGHYIIWEYYFTKLINAYLQEGRRISDLQRTVYFELEKVIEFSTRDVAPMLSMSEGWTVYPSFSESIFYLIAHNNKEEEAREWSINTLIIDVVPSIIKFISHHEKNAFMR